MANAHVLRLARETDLAHIDELYENAVKWLAAMGTDQWQEPWPDQRARDERVRSAVRAAKTWVLMNEDVLVGTITADWQGEPAPGLPALWAADERAVPAVYAHRVIVRRELEYEGHGIGSRMLDAIYRIGADAYGAEYLRLDAWTANKRLHSYYKRIGFVAVHTYDEGEINCPSGALFQKSAETFLGTVTAFAVNAADERVWRARARAFHGSQDTNPRNPTLTVAIAGR